MGALRQELERVFDDYWPAGWPRRRSAFLPGRAARAYPLVNVYEDPEAVYVEALAPGLDADSLDVSVRGNTLTLAGEKKPLEGVPDEAYHRSERATGRFVRTLQLDADVDAEKVEARYENGIVTITLPKSEKAKPKQIPVSVS
jgi:HSP20 family protein